MSKRKKRLMIACSVLLVLLISIICALSVSAQERLKIGMFYVDYDARENSYCISGVDGTEPNQLELPERLGGLPVTGVKQNAFNQCKAKWFIVPKSYTEFEATAFNSRKSPFYIYLIGRKDNSGMNTVDGWSSDGVVIYGTVYPNIDRLLNSSDGALSDMLTRPDGGKPVSAAAFVMLLNDKIKSDDNADIDANGESGRKNDPNNTVEGEQPTVTAQITGIEIKTPPRKTEYIEGERFDKSGIEVNAVYSDGKTRRTSDYSFSSQVLTPSQNDVTISYKSDVGIFTADQPISVSKKVPEKLIVRTPPATKYYIEGQSFNSAGLVTAAKYNNGDIAVVTPTVLNTSPLSLAQDAVSLQYEENGRLVTASQQIKVGKREIVSLEVKTMPDVQSYYEGEKFISEGMVMTVSYNDGTGKDVFRGQYTYDEGALFVYGADTGKKIGYEEDGVYTCCYVSLEIKPKYPVGIKMVSQPSKTSYIEEQLFDKSGIRVEITYNTGDVAEFSSGRLQIENGMDATELQTTDTSVLLSFTESGHTVEVLQPVTVRKRLPTALRIVAEPHKLQYNGGYKFKDAGMTVEVDYDNGKAHPTTAYTFSVSPLTAGQNAVRISYAENGKSVTANQPIDVGPQLALYQKYNATYFRCSPCSGSGRISYYRSCTRCGGSGSVSRSCGGCGGDGSCYCMFSGGKDSICSFCGSPNPNGHEHQITCPDCGGSGSSGTTSCGNCSGSGEVEDTKTCGSCSGVGQKKNRIDYIDDFVLNYNSVPANDYNSKDGYWYIYKYLLNDDTAPDYGYTPTSLRRSLKAESASPLMLNITRPPKRIDYIEGESFNPERLTAEMVYSDGTVKALTAAELKCYDKPLIAGQTSVSIDYNGLTATQPITVIKKVPIFLRMTEWPTKINPFGKDGMAAEVTYSNGEKALIKSDNLSAKLSNDKQRVAVTYLLNGGSAGYEFSLAPVTAVNFPAAYEKYTVKSELKGALIGEVTAPLGSLPENGINSEDGNWYILKH